MQPSPDFVDMITGTKISHVAYIMDDGEDQASDVSDGKYSNVWAFSITLSPSSVDCKPVCSCKIVLFDNLLWYYRTN